MLGRVNIVGHNDYNIVNRFFISWLLETKGKNY